MLEYGSRIAEITDFRVIDDKGRCSNTVEKGSCFKIRMKVRFNEEIQEPIMAYTFKNIQGTEITGTNTMYENAKIEHSGKGDICTVTFTQNMNLQGGEYLLSFGCTGYKNGDFTVFHRLYDACNITVISSKNTVGFYDMDSKVEVRCEEQVRESYDDKYQCEKIISARTIYGRKNRESNSGYHVLSGKRSIQ